MIMFILASIIAISTCYIIAEKLLKESTVEELSILLKTSSTSWLLLSGWGDEDFPEFSKAAWGSNDRKFYRTLMKRMKDSRYGESQKLLKKLIRIEDKRQNAKKNLTKGDEAYVQQSVALLSHYGKKEGFEGFLARFLIKRHKERIGNGIGS